MLKASPPEDDTHSNLLWALPFSGEFAGAPFQSAVLRELFSPRTNSIHLNVSGIVFFYPGSISVGFLWPVFRERSFPSLFAALATWSIVSLKEERLGRGYRGGVRSRVAVLSECRDRTASPVPREKEVLPARRVKAGPPASRGLRAVPGLR